jgi:hypothetical protein
MIISFRCKAHDNALEPVSSIPPILLFIANGVMGCFNLDLRWRYLFQCPLSNFAKNDCCIPVESWTYEVIGA